MSARGYLLDTNVLSATRYTDRNPLVADFLRPIEPSMVFISVMTLGEMRKGVIQKRRKALQGVESLSRWVDTIEQDFANRILGVDADIAKVWGELVSDRTRPVVDVLLAATAMVHNLTVVTRNVSDFRDLPVQWVNPWLP